MVVHIIQQNSQALALIPGLIETFSDPDVLFYFYIIAAAENRLGLAGYVHADNIRTVGNPSRG